MSTGAAAGNWRRATTGRAWVAVVLAVMDCGLLLLGGLGWYYSADLIPAQPLGGFVVLTVFAAVGIAVQTLIGLANFGALRAYRSGRPPRPAVRIAAATAWLAAARLLALLVTLTGLLGATGFAGTDPTDRCLLVMALLDAVAAAALALRTGFSLRHPA